MIAAVTGATGYAGQFIVPRLVREGIRVRAWRRGPNSALAGSLEGVEWVTGDLLSPDSMDVLLDGAEMLVHAALEHVPGKYRGGEGDDLERFIAANVGGSLTLLEKARRAGVGRCVFISSRAVFGGAARAGPIGDADATTPETHYGAAKASVEAFVQSWGLGEGWPVAALRPTGIYGLVAPLHRSKWVDIVAAALQDRLPEVSRAGSEVHARDVAEAVWMLLSADAERISGKCFNCSDLVVSTRDIVRTVHGLTGMSGALPTEAAPPGNVMACQGLVDLGMRFGGRELFERTVVDLIQALGVEAAALS